MGGWTTLDRLVMAAAAGYEAGNLFRNNEASPVSSGSQDAQFAVPPWTMVNHEEKDKMDISIILLIAVMVVLCITIVINMFCFNSKFTT